jgi:ABC-type multidrug transport system fused ATPase/permease subunit
LYLQLLSNLWKEFPSKRKREFFFFLGAMFLASCSEVISIGAVIPFLTILTTPDTLISINDFFGIFQLFDFINKENRNLMITIVFCIASTIACITRLYLLRIQINLSFNAGADIANKIFINSLDRPYSYHIYTNSNEIISGILTKSDTIIFHIILPCLTLISSITISIFIVAFLVSISPTLTFTIFVVFVFVYGAIAFITKSKLKANSLLTSKYNTLLLKILQESFRGIRELFLYNAKDIFLASFKDSDRVFRSAQASTSFISQSPKYLMEASGVILIASIAYFLTKSNNGDEVSTFALPILGSIALAAQRLLPLFQHIYAANSYLRGYKSSLVDVLDLLKIRASAIKVVNSTKHTQF